MEAFDVGALEEQSVCEVFEISHVAALYDQGQTGLQAVEDDTRTKAVWINTSEAPMADPFVMR